MLFLKFINKIRYTKILYKTSFNKILYPNDISFELFEAEHTRSEEKSAGKVKSSQLALLVLYGHKIHRNTCLGKL